MKKYLWIFLAAIIAIGLAFWVDYTLTQKHVPIVSSALPDNTYKTTSLLMGGVTFNALIADTPDLQALGLSYRSSIGSRDAMLFVFPQPEQLQFWMKDMNFSLDIIWLDANKHIIYMEQNLAPSTYPAAFGPTQAAQYVIEVAAGTAQHLNLSLGDSVGFTCNNSFCMR